MKISELGENAFIDRIRRRFGVANVALGIGDDAAIVDIPPAHSIVYCSDLTVENTHFIRILHPPESIGYKAIAVNVSDVGAMGGVPMFCTLSVAWTEDLDIDWVDRFLDGVARACNEFNVALVGGDTSAAERIFVDVSMIGRIECGSEVRRSGAKPGDGIYLTGSLGGSSLGLERLRTGDTTHPSVQRHLYPRPRHRVGHALKSQAHAMIDVSDGLSSDLSHILNESKVSARIYRTLLPAAPDASDANILHGGEEYELLIVAPDLASEIEGIPITRIGEIIPAAADPQLVLIEGARQLVLQPGGYQHFSPGGRGESR